MYLRISTLPLQCVKILNGLRTSLIFFQTKIWFGGKTIFLFFVFCGLYMEDFVESIQCVFACTYVCVCARQGKSDGRIPSQYCGNNFTLLTWSPRRLQQVKNTIAQLRGNGKAIYILYYIKNIVRKDGKRITCFATPYLVSGFFSSLIPSLCLLPPPTEVR